MPDPRLKRNSSGRFWSDSVLTLKSSSEPWIVPSEATESASGIRPLGAIGSGLYANGLMFVSSGIGR